MEGKPPATPLPSNPLERALTRVASAISAQTAETQRNTAATLQMAQQVAQLADAQRRADTSYQVHAERVAALVELEAVARRDLAEIRQAMTAQGLLAADTAREAREVRRQMEEWTPTGGYRLLPPEDAATAAAAPDKVETWVGRIVIGAAKGAKRHWPLAFAGGLGAFLKHAWALLHG